MGVTRTSPSSLTDMGHSWPCRTYFSVSTPGKVCTTVSRSAICRTVSTLTTAASTSRWLRPMGVIEVKNRWVSPQRRAWWRVRGCRRTITAAFLAPMPTLENRLVFGCNVMEAQVRRAGTHSHTPGAVSRSSST